MKFLQVDTKIEAGW